MNKILFFLLFFVSVGISRQVSASHCAGGELTYTWVSGNTYQFTLTLYRDCGGLGVTTATMTQTTADICMLNTCTNATTSFQIPKISGGSNGNPITTGCPAVVLNCGGGPNTIPVYGEVKFQGNYTVNGVCNELRFYYSLCCRNQNVQNIVNPTGQSVYIECKMNTVGNLNNNSPVFTSQPSAYTCVGYPALYKFSCTDVDGDSLVYSSIAPRSPNVGGPPTCDTGTNIAYTNAPLYDQNNPFPCNNTFVCNTANGYTSFTPINQSNVIVVIRVDEYRNGQWIGSIMRDLQIVIWPCNQPPITIYDTATSTVAIQGSQIQACLGDTVSYCKVITSAVVGGNISVLNVSPLPGMTVSTPQYIGTGYDSVLVCMTWIPSVNQVGWNVWPLLVTDSSCTNQLPFVIQSASIDSLFIVPQTVGTVDTTICAFVPVQMNVAAGAGTQYVWNALNGSGPGSLSCWNCTNPIATPGLTTDYTVESVLANQLGCPSVDTVTVIVANTPYVNCGPDITTCHNASPQMNPTIVGTAPSFAYSWSPTTYLSNPNVANPVVMNPDTTITYTLTVTPNGAAACSNIDIITVNVVGGFNITNIINRDTAICDGASIQVQATGSPAYTYTWIPNNGVSNTSVLTPTITPVVTAPDSVVYTIYAQNPNCPDSVQSFVVHVDPNPQVKISNDTLICHLDTANLVSVVTPASTYFYEWASPGGSTGNIILEPFDDQTFFAGYNISNGLNQEQIILTVATPTGCVGSDTMNISIVQQHFMTNVSDTAICPNDTVHYTVNGAVQYTWSPAAFLDLPNSNNVQLYPDASTIYSLVGIDNHGCYDSTRFQVTVMSNAVVEIGNNYTIYPGDSIEFNPSGNVSFYTWFPPYALNATNISNPLAKPEVSTRYYLTASTEFGCKAADSVDVIVLEESVFEIPNAFSPGTGTSNNDFLQVIQRGSGQLKSFKIYNRWGELVYSTTDINAKWDGMYKGKPQPMGVYSYAIEALTNKGKRVSKAGNITLLR